MFKIIRQITKDKITCWGFCLSLIISLTFTGFLIFGHKLSSIPEPLHYNIYFGVDVYGPSINFIWHLFAVYSILIINFIIACMSIERQVVASRMAAWFSLFFSVIVFTTTVLYIWYRP